MPILAALKRRHDGLTFSLKIDNSAAVLDQLIDHWRGHRRDGEDDLRPAPLLSMKLRDDRLVLFVPRAHPWAKRGRIPLADVAGRDLVVRERGSITREVFETRLAEAGLQARHADRGADARSRARSGRGRLRHRRRVRERVRQRRALPPDSCRRRRPRGRRIRGVPRGAQAACAGAHLHRHCGATSRPGVRRRRRNALQENDMAAERLRGPRRALPQLREPHLPCGAAVDRRALDRGAGATSRSAASCCSPTSRTTASCATTRPTARSACSASPAATPMATRSTGRAGWCRASMAGGASRAPSMTAASR